MVKCLLCYEVEVARAEGERISRPKAALDLRDLNLYFSIQLHHQLPQP